MFSSVTTVLLSILLVSLEADPADSIDATRTGKGKPRSESTSDAATEKEFLRLQAEDDAAQAAVDGWTRENEKLRAKGGGVSDADLKRRSRERFEPVRAAYEVFLARHPAHAQAHLLYGSFLSDREDEAGAQVQWEKALELDPKMPEAYHNLAGLYTETGQTKKALDYYRKAIELRPADASFYHSFGDSTYVLRKGIVRLEGITEQQVYARALSLYSNAVTLEPTNFLFTSDYAQTYYALDPLPYEAALRSWTNALGSASHDGQRQMVHVHLARLKMLDGRYDESRAHLTMVTNQECSQLRSNLLRRLDEQQKPSADAKKQ